MSLNHKTYHNEFKSCKQFSFVPLIMYKSVFMIVRAQAYGVEMFRTCDRSVQEQSLTEDNSDSLTYTNI